jgi:DNA polymerase-3 subunit alpha/error-prone DNA polymerase
MASRLGLYSYYSLLDGILSIEQWIEVCKAHNINTIAISDKDNIYGLHELLEVAHQEDIGVVVSATLTTPLGPIWVFVKSPIGFSHLCSLLSYNKGADYPSLLCTSHEGLIVATSNYTLLERLKGSHVEIYAALTSGNFEAVTHAKALNIELIAIEDALYTQKEQEKIHRVLRAIATGKTLGTLSEEGDTSSSFFHNQEEYERIFAPWPQAIANSEKIGELCKDIPLFSSLIFPVYPMVEGTSEQELRKRVYQGAHERYGELSDAIIERIEYELTIINKKGFSSYFLIMNDIIKLASRSCGRGSGAASIVSYSLYITQVDPIAYNLYFERFLNLSREDMPDIDVDFAWDERDAIVHQVFKRFKSEHCARVANHNCFRYRSAIRECAKAHGLSDETISSFLKGKNSDPLWSSIIPIAQTITGFPRSLSTHCGGIVITPKETSSYVPLTLSREGYPLATWEKEGVERAGLVKIDLLGNRSLAVIRDTLEALKDSGIIIDEHLWNPSQDEKTIELLQRGDSMGVFYIESPAMRQLQKRTQKGDFDHIVIHSSMIRPAANTYINEYVKRLHGEAWEPIHPLLEEMLKETYGIMCYQEDVSKAAIVLAGFSESEADQLRKIIAKKNRAKRLPSYEKLFIEGCKKNNIGDETIEKVWQMMLSFEGYSFNKPHSASYAMVSFQSAYLRTHHGAYFMAAVLSNQGGFYRPSAYISECRRMGLELRGVDINESDYHYRGEGQSVIVGFMAISQLQKQTIDMIVEERKRDGFFHSLKDVSERLSIGHTDLTSLVSSGAFDSISSSLPRSEQLQQLLTTRSVKKGGEQQDLFTTPSHTPFTIERENGRALTRKENRESLLREYQSLGFLREHHILYLYAKEIMHIRRIKGYQIPHYVEKMVTLIGYPITKKTIVTKNELLMDFISFEDETSLYETLIFPAVHKRYQTLLMATRPLILNGIVHKDGEAYTVEVHSIRLLIK